MSRTGQARPRCNRCHGEIRALPCGPRELPRYEHETPQADGHTAVYDVGILSGPAHQPSHKAEVDRAFATVPIGHGRRRTDPNGVRYKVRPEDWDGDS